jgi:hypothetical protein
MSDEFVGLLLILRKCTVQNEKKKIYMRLMGARCDAVGWGTVLQAERSRVRFQIAQLEFLFT